MCLWPCCDHDVRTYELSDVVPAVLRRDRDRRTLGVQASDFRNFVAVEPVDHVLRAFPDGAFAYLSDAVHQDDEDPEDQPPRLIARESDGTVRWTRFPVTESGDPDHAAQSRLRVGLHAYGDELLVSLGQDIVWLSATDGTETSRWVYADLSDGYRFSNDNYLPVAGDKVISRGAIVERTPFDTPELTSKDFVVLWDAFNTPAWETEVASPSVGPNGGYAPLTSFSEIEDAYAVAGGYVHPVTGRFWTFDKATGVATERVAPSACYATRGIGNYLYAVHAQGVTRYTGTSTTADWTFDTSPASFESNAWVEPAPDGGFYACGTFHGFGSSSVDYRQLIRADGAGALMWSRQWYRNDRAGNTVGARLTRAPKGIALDSLGRLLVGGPMTR